MKLRLTIASGLVGLVGMLPHAAHAQTYTRTDTIVYQDDMANWVLGNVAQRQSSAVVAGRTYPNQVVDQTIYDANDLPWKIYKFGKLQQTRTYNADGTIATVADGAGHVITPSNWKRGIPQTITYPATPDQPTPATKSAVVNDDGTIASATDETGAKTCYDYDPMERVKKITYPSESQWGVCDTSTWAATTITFNGGNGTTYGVPAGNWRQTILTGNARHILVFDALWRPIVDQTLELGNSINTTSEVIKRYDDGGHLAFQSYPMNTNGQARYDDTTLKGVRTTYDALDRVTQVDQDSELPNLLSVLSTKTAYLSGFKTQVTNPRQVKTITSYMMFDEPRYDWPVDIDAADGTTEEADTDITRDPFGAPSSIVRHNAGGTVTEARNYVYNAFHELCKTVEPESGSTLQHFDVAGNLDWSAAGLALPGTTSCDDTNATVAARKVARTYDARNRLLTLSFPVDGLGNQSWHYFPDGLPQQIATNNVAGSSASVVNTYAYNSRRLMTVDRVSQTDWGYIWSVLYGYDANGHMANLSFPDRATVDFAPNALGQATKAGSYATGVSYYPNGAIKQFTYGNGIVHTLFQNTRQLPDTSCDSYGPCDASSVLNDGYDYDANGNVAAISDGRTGAHGNRTMTYDGLDRLTKVVAPGLYGTQDANYTYDALDNLTHVGIGGPVTTARDQYYCYDAHWWLTNLKTGSCTTGATVVGIDFDAQGNLSKKNGTNYAFDFGNRLRQVSTPSGVIETYRYDGWGRRVEATSPTSGSIISQYSKDGQLLFQQNKRTGLNIAYIYLGGSLVATSERPITGSTYTAKYQHTDALGSPVAVTDANRNLVEPTDYEPYGKVINRPAHDGPGYTGHVEDAATSLDYMQQRYYDPQIGTFLSVDPISANPKTGGNFNRYRYASDNPYSNIDPDGRWDCKASKSQCKQARRSIDLIQKARRRAIGNGRRVLDQVAKLLGTEGDGNGVVIENTTEDAGKWVGLEKGGVIKVNFSVLSDFGGGRQAQDFMVASVISHEGWHGAWDKLAYAAGISDPWSRSYEWNDERRAGITEGILAQALGLDHPQGFWTKQGGFDMKLINEQATKSTAIYCAQAARSGLSCSD